MRLGLRGGIFSCVHEARWGCFERALSEWLGKRRATSEDVTDVVYDMERITHALA